MLLPAPRQPHRTGCRQKIKDKALLAKLKEGQNARFEFVQEGDDTSPPKSSNSAECRSTAMSHDDKTDPSRVAPLWCFVALFVVAVPFNYFWEMAQGFLFVGMDWGRTSTWLHCFIASLGDGVLVWIIFVVGWFSFKRTDWFVYPRGRHYSVMLIVGLCLGIVVEWVAVRLINRWAYTEQMPLIPGLAIGLVPVIQMVVLPLVIFSVVAAWIKHRTLSSWLAK